MRGSSRCCLLLLVLCAMTCQLEEDVVERRAQDDEVVDLDACSVEPPNRVGDRTLSLAQRYTHGRVLKRRIRTRQRGERLEGPFPLRAVCEPDLQLLEIGRAHV